MRLNVNLWRDLMKLTVNGLQWILIIIKINGNAGNDNENNDLRSHSGIEWKKKIQICQ